MGFRAIFFFFLKNPTDFQPNNSLLLNAQSGPREVHGGVITVNPDTDRVVIEGQEDQTDSVRLSLIDGLPAEETVSTLTQLQVSETHFLLL